MEKLALRVYQHLSISLSSNSLPRVFLWSYIKANMIFLFLKWYIEFLTDFKIACSKMSSLLVSNEIPMACFKEKQNVNYTLTKWQCMFWLQIVYEDKQLHNVVGWDITGKNSKHYWRFAICNIPNSALISMTKTFYSTDFYWTRTNSN